MNETFHHFEKKLESHYSTSGLENPMGRIHAVVCFCKYSFTEAQPCCPRMWSVVDFAVNNKGRDGYTLTVSRKHLQTSDLD